MRPFDGKIIICVKRNLLFISHRIVHVPRETLSGLLHVHIRGIFDVITAWQQGVWSIMAGIFKIQIRVNNTNVGNFGKKTKCTV